MSTLNTVGFGEGGWGRTVNSHRQHRVEDTHACMSKLSEYAVLKLLRGMAIHQRAGVSKRGRRCGNRNAAGCGLGF